MGASGHCAGLVLAELGHWPSPAASALGALRVPQIQFIDFVVVEALFSSSTEPGTHSLKLCIMDWIDMPVVVHVMVVDISGVAQTQFPMVRFSRDSTVTVH